MEYPAMNRNKVIAASLPSPIGGVDLSRDATDIRDNQCTDMSNFWARGNTLVTRPSIVPSDEYLSDVIYEYDFEMFGEQRKLLVYRNRFSIVTGEETQNIPVSPGNAKFINALVPNAKIQSATVTNVVHDAPNPVGYLIGTLVVGGINVYMELNYSASLYPAFSYAHLSWVSFDNGVVNTYGNNPYIPTVVINKSLDGTSGDTLEDYNILTPYFKEEFNVRTNYPVGDESISEIVLRLSQDKVIINYNTPALIELFGVFVIEGEMFPFTTGYKLLAYMTGNSTSYLYLLNSVDADIEELDNAINMPHTVRYDNNNLSFVVTLSLENAAIITTQIEKIRITVAADNDFNYDAINNFNISTWFGGARSGLESGTRLFLSGSDTEPNLLRWSALNMQNYFPENNFAYVGNDTLITAFGKQENYLVLFKADELYAMEYLYDVDNGKTTVYFPVTPISPSIGCDCPNTIQLINDRLVWAHSRGYVYTLVGANQYSERSVRELSLYIRPALAKDAMLSSAVSADYKGHYLLLAGNKGYIWNYDAMPFLNSESSQEAQEMLAWYLWDIDSVDSLFVNAGKLYCTIDGNEYVFEDGHAVPCSYSTKLFAFDAPFLYKRVSQLFIGIDSEEVFDAEVTIKTESGNDPLSSTVTNKYNMHIDRDMHRINARVNRARLFGYTLSADAFISIQGGAIKYEIHGEVK